MTPLSTVLDSGRLEPESQRCQPPRPGSECAFLSRSPGGVPSLGGAPLTPHRLTPAGYLLPPAGCPHQLRTAPPHSMEEDSSFSFPAYLNHPIFLQLICKCYSSVIKKIFLNTWRPWIPLHPCSTISSHEPSDFLLSSCPSFGVILCSNIYEITGSLC